MRRLDVTLRFFAPSQGGRIPPPGFDVYRPHFRVGSDGEMLGVAFVAGPKQARADTEFEAVVALVYDIDYSALQPGVEFDVLEGSKRVAAGRVIRRFEDDKD
jgi:hypothetical protein